MKKILLSIALCCAALGANAQVMKIYKGSVLVATYGSAQADKVVFEEENSAVSDTREYVDLGLASGTLWATCNIGASSPEQYGDYFAWGETAGYNDGKTAFEWSNYTLCDGAEDMLNRYCTESDYGTVDNVTELVSADDAATVKWGKDWCMPTSEQMKELKESCTWTKTTMNGITGYRATGPNGKSIFLPCAGYCSNSVEDTGYSGNYWSRSLKAGSPDYAYFLCLYNGAPYTSDEYRYYGQSIRPVAAKAKESGKVLVESITLSESSITLGVGGKAIVSYTVLPSNATNKKLFIYSNNPMYAEVHDNGDGTATIYAESAGFGTITFEATDGSDIEAECTVTVTESGSGGGSGSSDDEVDKWADLGLPSGTLWATCNVGASSPEEYGDYFAWGETVGYNNGKTTFNWANYTLCTSSSEMTKYGDVDDVWGLDLTDDAAYTRVGGRMPSEEQCKELLNEAYTTNEWTTLNGVNGLKITSLSNGKSIFLPATGYRYDVKLCDAGFDGWYWSCTLDTSNPTCARCMKVNGDWDVKTTVSSRFYGMAIRPVKVKQ